MPSVQVQWELAETGRNTREICVTDRRWDPLRLEPARRQRGDGERAESEGIWNRSIVQVTLVAYRVLRIGIKEAKHSLSASCDL